MIQACTFVEEVHGFHEICVGKGVKKIVSRKANMFVIGSIANLAMDFSNFYVTLRSFEVVGVHHSLDNMPVTDKEEGVEVVSIY